MTYFKTGLALAAVTALSGCYNEYNRNSDNVLVKGDEYNLETGVNRVSAGDAVSNAVNSGNNTSNDPI